MQCDHIYHKVGYEHSVEHYWELVHAKEFVLEDEKIVIDKIDIACCDEYCKIAEKDWSSSGVGSNYR
ncbi:hypothetical protein GOBAR_AA28998 [Gossypium barbadense]|uniref:Uncharacterized protein n=1 Tax=Gossypium barbadense TaxID=3634 RepID=A0A2P5WKR6_GOSBA|nr:hypothetical protein GOBAR_AA28998 [Gossypium barbadense]